MTPPSKWLFFPTPSSSSSGTLQTITWNMTGSDAASVSSSGAAIINPAKTSQLAWSAGRPRFWNGEAAEDGDDFNALSGGRYNFTSGATCRVWWHLYAVSVTLNGGSPQSMNATSSGGSGGSAVVAGAVSGSCQTSYINTSGVDAPKGSAFVSGDVLVFTVTSAS
tara:strand:- start:1169 stop:1663 length:495 start_codon:yes stop_codon:yes gene_type:complete